MYSKSNILLFIAYTIFTGLLILSKQYEVQAESIDSAKKASAVTEQVALERLESLERIISYETLKPQYCIEVSEQDMDTLMRIVEAEAGGEDRTGKL